MDESLDTILDRLQETKPPAPPPTVRDNTSSVFQDLANRIESNPLVGRPQWEDQSIPLGERVQDFLHKRAQSTVDYGIRKDEWGTVEQELQQRFPGVSTDKLREPFESQTRLQRTRALFSDREETPEAFFMRRSIPITSAIIGFKERQNYKSAVERIQEGKPNDNDYETVAIFEQLQKNEQAKGTSGQIASALASIPAMVGEAMLGGAIVSKAKFLSPAAQTARTLPLAEGAMASSKVAEVAKLAGRHAATTALAPSFYLPQAAERALQGGEWYELKNLGSSYALGALQLGLLNAAGKAGEKLAGEGVRAYLAGVGTGMAGQQAADITAGFMGLQSNYGIIGDLLSGEKDKALQHATVQAVTFAAFGLLHRGTQEPKLAEGLMTRYRDALDYLQAEGMSKQKAAGELEAYHGRLNEAMQAHPDLDARQALNLFAGAPEGAMARYAEALTSVLKQPAPRNEQAPPVPVPEPAPPPVSKVEPPRPEPMSPEQASAALEKETARQQVEGRNSSRRPETQAATLPVEPPRPADPLEAATHDQVRALAKSLGLASAGSKDVVLKRLTDKISEPITRQLLEKVMAPAEAPKPIQPIPRPEEAQQWRDTGTEFREQPEGPTTFKGRDGGEYRVEAQVETAPENVSGHAGQKRARVRVYDAEGKEAGHVDFYQTPEGQWRGEGLSVAEGLRGKGISEAMYDFLTAHGEKIVPAEGRTPEGKRFWERNREATGRPPAAPPASAAPQAAPSPPEPPPAAPEPTLTGERPTMEMLRQRFEAGEPVTLSEVMNTAGLSAKERHVIEERLLGRTHEDINNDKEMRKSSGGKYKSGRARIEQIEADAMAKLGAHGSLAKLVHEGQKIDGALERSAAGERVTAADLHGDPEVVARKIRNKLTREERAHEEAVRAFLEEKERAKRSGASDRLIREADALSQEGKEDATARNQPENAPAPVPEGNPPSGEGATGRPEGQGPPPPEAPPAGGSATPGSKAPRVEDYIPRPPLPERKRSHTDWGYEETVLRSEGTRTMLAEVQSEGGINPDSMGKGEQESLPREVRHHLFRDENGRRGRMSLDEMADNLARRFGQEGRHEREGGGTQWLLDAVVNHHPPEGESPGTSARKYQQQAHEEWRQNALDYFERFYGQERAEKELNKWIKGKAEPAMRKRVLAETKLEPEEVSDASQALRRAGEKPLTDEEVAGVEAEARQQVAAEAGLGDAAEGPIPGGAEGTAAESGPDPWDEFVVKPGGTRGGVTPEEAAAQMLAQRLSEGLPQQGTAAPAGTPAAIPPSLREQVVAAGKRFVASLWDSIRELGGAMAPRTTRKSPEAGDAVSRFNASDIYAREAVPHLIDHVLGPDARPNDAVILGGVLVETRLRHMREQFVRRGETAKAQAVKSIIGQPIEGDVFKNPFLSEAEYQQYKADPLVQEAIKRYQDKVVQVMERNYRDAQGLEPTDPINTYTQIPGLPVNFKAFRAGDPVTDAVVKFAGSKRGEPTNPKARRFGFAEEAAGDADGYDIHIGSIIENSIVKSTALAAKAQMYRTLVAEGLATWGKRGQQVEIGGEGARELKEITPPRGTQEAEKGETSLYLHPDVYGEVRKALQVDEPWRKWWGTGMLAKATLASTVEAAYHGKNLLTFLFKPGVSPVDMLRNAYRVVSKDAATGERLVELARIGALKEPGLEAGMLWGGKTDPTAWMSSFLEVMQKTMRLTADDAFNRLERSGRVEGSEGNRRDFINQLGQYNQRAQNGMIAWLRQTGLGPFATAGSNFYMQGLKALAFDPGVKAPTMAAAVGLRAEMFARTMAVMGSVAVANYLNWGRVDGDDKTPVGALKVGDKNGRTSYLDLTALTGMTRGARETGLLALAEGRREGAIRSGAKGPDILERAFKDITGALLHPAEGPAVSFAHTAMTGENTIGRRVAPPKEQGPYLQAAVMQANPILATIAGQQTRKDAPALDRLMQLLGPFGLKTSGEPRGAPHRSMKVPIRK